MRLAPGRNWFAERPGLSVDTVEGTTVGPGSEPAVVGHRRDGSSGGSDDGLVGYGPRVAPMHLSGKRTSFYFIIRFSKIAGSMWLSPDRNSGPGTPYTTAIERRHR